VSIVDIEAAANAAHLAHRFIAATYTAPDGWPTPTRIDIDRAAKVIDERGIVHEDRCEISLIVDEVGEGVRGAQVDMGNPDDVWTLMEPIGSDGYESRWVAVRG